MRAIKGQYFFAFAVMGSLLPYLPVYLSQQGLTDPQVGWVLGGWGLAVLLTPVLVTLLADAHLENRTLLAASFCLTGLGLAWMLAAEGFWPILLAHGMMTMALAPVLPVQDGLFFRQQQRVGGGAYHRVRVYGTLGYIVPSLLLYAWLSYDADTGVTLIAAIVCCALGAANAWLLPRFRTPSVADGAPPRVRLPTFAAARVMLEPRVLTFCVAMWLVHVAIAAYYAFYPIYLSRSLGIDMRWIGLISTVGVVVEIAFILGFGWLSRVLGLRGVMVIGAAGMVLRFALLWLYPNVYVAVGTQALHGLMVLVVHIAPPIYLNGRADDSYRSSIQGLFVMFVQGAGRIVGNAAAGYIADISLTTMFACSAAVCAVTVPMFLAALADGSERGQPAPGRADPEAQVM